MILRGNLATRPFYNERAVQAVLVTLAAVLGLLTVFTVWQFGALTAQQRELSAQIARDESRAASLRAEAQRIRGRMDARQLEATARATREVNAIIDARTFSWTALFNVIERTIPADVRLKTVTPSFDEQALTVRFVVNARDIESVALFLDRLEAAGAFSDLQTIDERALDDDTLDVTCEGRYLGPGSPSEPTPSTGSPGNEAAAGAAPGPAGRTGGAR